MRTHNDLLKRIEPAACAALFLSLTLFVFGPSQIYLTNAKEFYFLWSELLLSVVPVALLFTLFATLILYVMRKIPGAYGKAVSLVVALSILLWLQGNVFVHDLGVLDRRPIDWNAYRRYAIPEAALWAAVLLVAYLRSGFVFKHARKIATAFIAVQLVSTGMLGFREWRAPGHSKYGINDDYAFVFSKERNAIILVLDTFQGDIFQEIVSENSSYAEIFDGFTFFRNALGGYPTTYASIPLMLTGHYYDNSVPMRAFLEEAYLSDSSISKVLLEEGYRVDLFGSTALFYASSNVASNFARRRAKAVGPEVLAHVLDVTLLRYAPLLGKPYVHNDEDWFLSRIVAAADARHLPRRLRWDIDFASKMAAKARTGSTFPTLKFYMLWVPHPPFRMNEDLQFERMDWSRDSYKRQSKGALVLAGRILETLKEMDIYDSSMILLMGDHGCNIELTQDRQEYPVRLPGEGTVVAAGQGWLVPGRVHSSGLPLILVKRFNERGGLKTSDAPVSLADVPKTIAQELGVGETFLGVSFFEVEESAQRERRFLSFFWQHAFWHGDYLPKMTEYIVSGHSWLSSSWRPTYHEFVPGEVKYDPPDTVELGEPVRFGRGGNAAQYQGCGWSFPEAGLTWTAGRSAHLAFPVPPLEEDLLMKATFWPLVAQDRRAKQRVEILIDGEPVGYWEAKQAGEYKVTIPSKYLGSSLSTITFELPDAASPEELGLSDDKRVLALAMQAIVFQKLPDAQAEAAEGDRGGTGPVGLKGETAIP